MSNSSSWLAGLLALLLCAVCVAKDAPPASDDPVLEQRVTAIALELRCLVCQNQTIADSHAPLAIDLRNQIREKLAAGASEESIKTYMVDRYGDFVLYRPPVKATTLLLWFGPFALLAGGFTFMFIYLGRRRKSHQAEKPLDAEERARALQILDTGAPSE